MGRVKEMCMDMEDKYVDLSLDNVNDCEHIEEYFKKVSAHSHFVDWRDDWQEWQPEILTDNCNNNWSKYNP